MRDSVLILQRARQLIASPEHWTRHDTARKADGSRAGYDDAGACQWCLVGAVYRAAYELMPRETWQFCRAAAMSWLYVALDDAAPDPVWFNDRSTTTHRDVLNLLDKAILQAKSAPIA